MATYYCTVQLSEDSGQLRYAYVPGTTEEEARDAFVAYLGEQTSESITRYDLDTITIEPFDGDVY